MKVIHIIEKVRRNINTPLKAPALAHYVVVHV
jgi:hypothetical protein